MSRVLAGFRTAAVLATTTLVALVSCHFVAGQCEHKKDPGAGHSAWPKAKASVDGPKHKLELNNESVIVLRVQIAARQKIPMHELTPRVAVWLTEAHLKLTYPDGRTEELRFKAGDTSWVAGGKHAGENLSDKPIEFIVVIPKVGKHPGAKR